MHILKRYGGCKTGHICSVVVLKVGTPLEGCGGVMRLSLIAVVERWTGRPGLELLIVRQYTDVYFSSLSKIE